jgi:bifunctional N-acetylglucosamine-1-phosphate-uridyltransferase/glucosamine-1-phosphate-acetyltransferase GlmU-like protein
MPHHAVYVPPVESVETVNISTNNFDAEQGITGGAAVTVVTTILEDPESYGRIVRNIDNKFFKYIFDALIRI